jgi:hypothetical protein
MKWRILLTMALAGSLLIFTLPHLASTAGTHYVPSVAGISGILPPWWLAPRGQQNCLARLEQVTGAGGLDSVSIRQMCYRGVQPGPDPPPPAPPPYVRAEHD